MDYEGREKPEERFETNILTEKIIQVVMLLASSVGGEEGGCPARAVFGY